jgi:hypothetical protein
MLRASTCKATSQVSYAWTILAMPHVAHLGWLRRLLPLMLEKLLHNGALVCKVLHDRYPPVLPWAKLGAHAVRTAPVHTSFWRRIPEHILSRIYTWYVRS